MLDFSHWFHEKDRIFFPLHKLYFKLIHVSSKNRQVFILMLSFNFVFSSQSGCYRVLFYHRFRKLYKSEDLPNRWAQTHQILGYCCSIVEIFCLSTWQGETEEKWSYAISRLCQLFSSLCLCWTKLFNSVLKSLIFFFFYHPHFLKYFLSKRVPRGTLEKYWKKTKNKIDLLLFLINFFFFCPSKTQLFFFSEFMQKVLIYWFSFHVVYFSNFFPVQVNELVCFLTFSWTFESCEVGWFFY